MGCVFFFLLSRALDSPEWNFVFTRCNIYFFVIIIYNIIIITPWLEILKLKKKKKERFYCWKSFKRFSYCRSIISVLILSQKKERKKEKKKKKKKKNRVRLFVFSDIRLSFFSIVVVSASRKRDFFFLFLLFFFNFFFIRI